MGLFSRKKKLTKDERKELERARGELKKFKEDRENEFVPNRKSTEESEKTTIHDESNKIEIITDPLEIARINQEESEKIRKKHREELRQKDDLEKLNQREEEKILVRTGETYDADEVKSFGTCCALDCNVPDSVLNGKECKFCNNFCCIEHLLCHKHDCVKDRQVKFVRKQWIRKYGLNVSTGQYNVVCDVCGYVSHTASLIEIAGEERLSHISEKGCDSTKVFLENII